MKNHISFRNLFIVCSLIFVNNYSSKAQNLTASDATSPTVNIINTSGGAGATSNIVFQTYPTQYPQAKIQAIDVGGWAGDLAFFTKKFGDPNYPLVERLRIAASLGNVGIGTSNPTARLHVEGDQGGKALL